MYSITYLIARLYPDASLEEKQRLADTCWNKGREYYDRTWSVTKDDLSKEEVQLNLVMTLFKLQFRPSGIIQSITQSLEVWSVGTIVFSDLSDRESAFYERYYTFLGFLHFDQLSIDQQIFLLGERLLPLACVWEVPIYANVQQYFVGTTSISLLQEHALTFATAIALNPTILSTPGRVQRTVGDWVRVFNQYEGKTPEGRVDEFMETNMEVSRLTEEEKKAVYSIVTLYYGLITGIIYKEIKGEDFLRGTQRVPPVTDKRTSDYYLELLLESDEPQFKAWLEDNGNVVEWIITTRKDNNFINHLFYIVAQRAVLEDEVQLQNLLGFLESMKNAGWSLGADLLYFDEKDGQFHWNPDMVQALKEEVEYLAEQRQSDKPSLDTTRGKPADLAAGIKELTK